MHANLDSLKLGFLWCANRSSAVWRYFSITDEGKAICKICEQAVSSGGQKKARLLRDLDIVMLDKAVGAGTAGTAGAVPLFQDNNVIVFILQNLQHATHDSEAGEHIPRLLVY